MKPLKRKQLEPYLHELEERLAAQAKLMAATDRLLKAAEEENRKLRSLIGSIHRWTNMVTEWSSPYAVGRVVESPEGGVTGSHTPET